MARFEFQDIKFKQGKDQTDIKVDFLKLYETKIDAEQLLRLGEYKIKDGAIEFSDMNEKQAQNKFLPLITNSFLHLTNKLTKHHTVYIHKNSSIPLVGTLYFGIVDRGTNIIEVKPVTGCNIDCVFCSVDEGTTSGKLTDYVVEDEYIIQEANRIIEYKQQDKETKIDVFINTHGEPLLYSNIINLVRGLREIKQVNTISIITNGTLLTKKLADELVDAGLNQINISINAIDDKKAKELAATESYNISNVSDIAKYISKKIKVVLAPVWIKGLNDEQIPKIIAFATSIGAEIGIQNYIVHKMGRKVADQEEWSEFYNQLDNWERYTGAKLRTITHTSYSTKTLEKPFQKGDVVKAEIVAPGRLKGEMLAAAKDRVISVVNCRKVKGQIKLKILKDKDNIFVAEEA